MKRTAWKPAVRTSVQTQHAVRITRTFGAILIGRSEKFSPSPWNDLQQLSKRRGSIFHYYLVYMLLTGALLSAAGLCLHAVLKADRLDAQISRHLNTLLRLEQTLRRDFEMATDAETSTASLLLSDNREQSLEWIISGNIIRREGRTGDRLTNSERFVFRKGTQFEFARLPATNVMRLTITDPPVIPSHQSETGEMRTRKAVEILLRPSAFRIHAGSKDGNGGTQDAEDVKDVPEPEGEAS